MVAHFVSPSEAQREQEQSEQAGGSSSSSDSVVQRGVVCEDFNSFKRGKKVYLWAHNLAKGDRLDNTRTV